MLCLLQTKILLFYLIFNTLSPNTKIFIGNFRYRYFSDFSIVECFLVFRFSRYAGQIDHPLYYDEREKMGRERGGTLPNPQRSYNRSQQLAPSPRYPRNGYPRERHTVDRERFPKFNDADYDREEEIPPHRRSGGRREVSEMAYSSPSQQRHPMRHSEDRQIGGFSHMRQSTRDRDRGGAGKSRKPPQTCELINFLNYSV